MGVAEQTVTKSTVAGVYFLRLRAIALALRGPPVFRSFYETPALIERRYSCAILILSPAVCSSSCEEGQLLASGRMEPGVAGPLSCCLGDFCLEFVEFLEF